MRIKIPSLSWYYYLFVFCIIATFFALGSSVSAASPFITTWKTDIQGSSGPKEITIPTNGSVSYDYYVDWGDGTSSSNVTGDITHTYALSGTYTVAISGQFPRIFFSNSGDKNKILSVEQWGSTGWTSTEAAFFGAKNLVINATDAPNLSSVTNASYMFRDAQKVNSGFENWDVSNVRIFGRMFSGAAEFNADISSWNMSNASNVEYMFSDAVRFNQDISSWNMSNVGVMRGMFAGAISFDQSVNSWNLSKVFNVENMFKNASSFDKALGGWNIGSFRYIQGLLSGVSLSTDQYDSMLVAWSQNQTAKNITLDAGNSTFCKGIDAKNYLTGVLGWTILDGGSDTVFCGAVNVTFGTPPLIEEGKPIGTLIGTLSVESSLPGTFSLSLNCSNPSYDSQFFELDNNNRVYTASVFDFEKPQDENQDNAYEMCVRISNQNSESTEKYVLITISNVEADSVQGGGQIGVANNNEPDNNDGEVLGRQTEGSEDGNNTGKVLAATGVAVGLIGVYVGLALSGTTSLTFPRIKK